MKKVKKFASMILILALIASLSAPLALAANDPGIRAGAAMLVETVTGRVLYEKNADVRMKDSGLSRMMTLLLAAEAIEAGKAALEDVITVGEAALEGVDNDSSKSLEEEEEISLRSLMYCIQMAWLPEAANALAIHISGSVSSFVRQMNSRASELGCTNTNFTNPGGVEEDGQYTTARDMYTILSAALACPEFCRVFMASDYTVSATNEHSARVLTTDCDLILQNSDHFYENATGGTMSYSDDDGYSALATAESMSLSMIGVMIRADWAEEGSSRDQMYSEMRRLFDWGISSFSYQYIVSAGERVTSVPVRFGNGTEVVYVKADRSISALLDSSEPLSAFTKTMDIYSQREGAEELQAPISAGEELGEMSIYRDGELYGKVKLVAATSVDLQRTQYLKQRIKEALEIKGVKLGIVLFILMFVLYFAYVIFYNARKRKKAAAAAGKRGADRAARRNLEMTHDFRREREKKPAPRLRGDTDKGPGEDPDEDPDKDPDKDPDDGGDDGDSDDIDLTMFK